MSVIAFTLVLVVACGLTWFATQRRAGAQLIKQALLNRARNDQAERAWERTLAGLAAENDSLRARNDMLSGLVGDVERAALTGARRGGGQA